MTFDGRKGLMIHLECAPSCRFFFKKKTESRVFILLDVIDFPGTIIRLSLHEHLKLKKKQERRFS
jgi:hypothetical protein